MPATLIHFVLSFKGCAQEDFLMSVNRWTERPLFAYLPAFVLVCDDGRRLLSCHMKRHNPKRCIC